MAHLTRDEVRAIAHLARLHLSDDEVDALAGDLAAILSHMEELASVDTDGVEPMTHAVPMKLRLRPDRVEESLPAEVATGQAPDRDGDLFQVPRIIES